MELSARDCIATFLALRTGLWVEAARVKAAALSHGIGLAEFYAASGDMIARGEIVLDGAGAWREGAPRAELP